MRPQQDSPEPAGEVRPRDARPSALAGAFEVTLPCTPGAPAAARGAVTAWMAGHVSEAMLTDTQLLVVELVTNSVRHADTPAEALVSVRARVSVHGVRLESRTTAGRARSRAGRRICTRAAASA